MQTRTSRFPVRKLLPLLALCGLISPAAAQSPAPANTEPKKTVALDSLPPAQRLGLRVNLLDRQVMVIPTVVIVPDESSYVAAIAGWQTTPTGAIRYPVLIDTGTWASRTRIARFIRAFAPRAVVRWAATEQSAKLPVDPAARRLRIESAAASAWSSTPADLNQHWTSLGFAPPGVVVCSPTDPAWTAGLALAAGRGQPMLWIESGFAGDPALWMGTEAADALNNNIMKGLDGIGRPYNALGDDIEAVTLCMTTPTRVYLGEKDKRKFLSLTDWVGRSDEAHKRTRWAWCGQIMGDSARAAHDAMCALFLSPAKAWLFDGYPSSDPWNQYDMTKAAAEIEKIGVKTILDDADSGASYTDLRRRAAGIRQGGTASSTDAGMGVDAGLIAINTKGNPDFFTLPEADAKPADLPILRRPAMAYIVHSFSLASPTSRPTVGGILLERGAYAYLGSADEPYLQAFIPTPIFMIRVSSGYPFGAAGRLDGGDIWKLATLGDPLITIGPGGKRAESPAVPLQGVQDVPGQLPEQLRAREFEAAMWTLALSQRDQEAARLLTALLKDDPKACTPVVALAGISSAFFTGDYPAFLKAARAAVPAFADEGRVRREGFAEVRDMVWQAINPGPSRLTSEELDLMFDYLRPEVLDRDASQATRAAELVRGMGAGRAVLDKVAEVRRRVEAANAAPKSAPAPAPSTPPTPASPTPKGK